MGVHGITKLVRDLGWLPTNDHRCCSSSLWRDQQEQGQQRQSSSSSPTTTNSATWFAPDHDFSGLRMIAPQSTFLVDGNGLAFHLHGIAYARHVQDITNRGPGQECMLAKKLSTSQVAQILPCMMPLGTLKEVTIEFVTSLRKRSIKLRVYWDGPLRRFKALTGEKRASRIQEHWGTLQQYCLYGSMPKEQKACEWSNKFPYSGLFLKCVRHTLEMAFVPNIDCQEEADVELARVACDDPTAYVIGNDSDFLFYRNIQYVPLNCISLTSTGVQVFCATRSELAEFLGLEDEQMTELAILMGNDYVDTDTLIGLPSRDQLVDFLRDKDSDFRIESTGDGTELEFVRCLYDLQDIDQFPLDERSSSPQNINKKNYDQELIHEIETVISFPKDFPSHLATIIPNVDKSVVDATIRCLQAYIDMAGVDGGNGNDSNNGGTSPLISQQHLDAYKTTMTSRDNRPVRAIPIQRRPTWENIRAVYIIETCISRILRSSSSSSDEVLAYSTPPDSLVHHIRFHSILATLQQQQQTVSTPSIPRLPSDAEIGYPTANADDSGEAGDNPIPSPPTVVESVTLPIDEHREAILERIQNERVTIIHGETGCGKSTRVPIMIMEAPPPDPSMSEVKLFISQPRRIAAKALVERIRSCEPKHKEKFALRMGHGWREYESRKTQAWFVTTGYLSRLLANYPEKFDDCTHLIIDEVHERSVDTDILCLLCRRLLESNKKIRLVLMSATLATKMYQDYFSVENGPIHVGVRRFPIREHFIEDIYQNFKLPPAEKAAAIGIQNECEKRRCTSSPTNSDMNNRYKVAARLTSIVGQPGTSVLIFVPGMGEIIAIMEAIESFYVAGVRFTCFPIHSDIPFEDQMDAFVQPAQDEVKVIIATNAAESSVTLPAVDHVICLGLCRQIIYNEQSHRQLLALSWISRASATQRAGRTGRVRPGNVYRLYTRSAYTTYMAEFEPGEMVRIPLDAVILLLKEMLQEEAKPVLLDCIEPPNMETIDRSFQSLHRWNFITEPDDKGSITNLGSFVSSLGVDLYLGSLIGLGIQFGVAAEAIELAAVLSFPKTPFKIPNPLYQPAAQYNDLTCKIFPSKCHFDANLYSEPLAMMNVLWDYETVKGDIKFCNFFGLAAPRIKQLAATRNSLRKRVAEYLAIDEEKVRIASPPSHLPHGKITILRLIQLWVFSDTVIECSPTSLKSQSDGSVSLTLKTTSVQPEQLSESHFNQLLDPSRHPYMLETRGRIEQTGSFEGEEKFNFPTFMTAFEPRLVSYMCAMDIDIICYYNSNTFVVLVNEHKIKGRYISALLAPLGDGRLLSIVVAEYNDKKKRRGIMERNCGLWDIAAIKSDMNEQEQEQPSASSKLQQKKFRKLYLTFDQDANFSEFYGTAISALDAGEVSSLMIFEFHKTFGGKKTTNDGKKQRLTVLIRGGCNKIQLKDYQDMLGATTCQMKVKRNESENTIRFPAYENAPLQFKSGKGKMSLAGSYVSETSSWTRPLFNDIPEGARLLSVIASGLRTGGHRLRFLPNDKTPDVETIEVGLVKGETEINKRWRRLGTGSIAFVQHDTVPAAATHTSETLFACCANALELRGGGIKVEGLTLLPTNPLFLLLGLLSFGVEPNVPYNWEGDSSDQRKSDEDVQRNAMSWLRRQLTKEVPSNANVTSDDDDDDDDTESWRRDVDLNVAKQKIHEANVFHKSCMIMGEKLLCFPTKVAEVCRLFDFVDGNNVSLWDDLDDCALSEENLKKWRYEKLTRIKAPTDPTTSSSSASTSSSGNVGQQAATAATPTKGTATSRETRNGGNNNNNNNNNNDASPKLIAIDKLHKDVVSESVRWFATDLPSGENVKSTEFPSTNILSLLLEKFYELKLRHERQQEEEEQKTNNANGNGNGTKKKKGKKSKKSSRFSPLSMGREHWEIASYVSQEDGKMYYRAKFINQTLPIVPVSGRGKNKLPKWIKKGTRPQRQQDAMGCVPPNINCPQPIVVCLTKDSPVLMYDSIESALKMESAFYLDKQFFHAGKTINRRWYDRTLSEMLDLLRAQL